MVPLCLKDINNSLYTPECQNPRPSSPDTCLPKSFQHVAEMTDNIFTELRNIEYEAK